MTYIDISRIVQTNAPVHFKKMERDQCRTPNVLVHVYKMLVGGVRTIATPTKNNPNGEQNAAVVNLLQQLV